MPSRSASVDSVGDGLVPSRRTALGILAGALGLPVLGLTAACSGDDGNDDVPAGISPWSVSPSHGSGWDPSRWTEAVAATGVTNVRGFRVDSGGYETIRAAGFTSTGILQWSPPEGEYRFPVDDLQGWRDHVESTVRAYPEVRQWEMWNEPPNFTADPSPASYATIVIAAYEAAKGVDPDVRLGLAVKSTNVEWLREAIVAGAAGSYDYVTVHPYERGDNVVDGWEEPFLAVVPQLRVMLSEVDPDRAEVPVEFTEIGSPAAQHPGEEDTRSTPEAQARTLVQLLTLSLVQQVQRVSWYDPFDGDYDAGEAAYGLVALDGTARPALAAYANLIAALGERPEVVGVVHPRPESYLVVFRGANGGAAAVGWSRTGEQSVSFSGPVNATSATTGETTTTQDVPLTVDPAILVISDTAVAGGLIAEAQEAREARVAQAGLRTSGQWDAESGPAGLYVRGVGDPTVVDGRTVREPSSSAVQVAVGPDFDLAASALRIVAVVRGVRGEPGLNLKYDADAPLSSLDQAGQGLAGDGWIPIGLGEWRTLEWTVRDVRLAGMYGYNFQLDSDSMEFSGYQLDSITVEVLATRTLHTPA